MTEEKKDEKEKTFEDMLKEFARRVVGRDALLLMIFTCFIGAVVLYAAHAYAADVDKKVEPLRVELAQHKAEQALRDIETEKRLRNVEVNALETNLNVKLLVRDYARMEPIELVRSDGGVP